MYMEGPSLHLAAEQLQPFTGRRIERVAGNSKIGVERLAGLQVKEIFAWGKHLVFQFDAFALRVHFMLWGTFAATVRGRSVTGDYRRSGPPRLVLNFPNGEITIWAASVKFVEDAHARTAYDFSADVMADEWDGRGALAKVRAFPRSEIADVLSISHLRWRRHISKRSAVGRASARSHTCANSRPQIGASSRMRARSLFDFSSFADFLAGRTRGVPLASATMCGKIERRVHGQRARPLFVEMPARGITESSMPPKRRSKSDTNTRIGPPRGAAGLPRRARPRSRA